MDLDSIGEPMSHILYILHRILFSSVLPPYILHCPQLFYTDDGDDDGDDDDDDDGDDGDDGDDDGDRDVGGGDGGDE